MSNREKDNGYLEGQLLIAMPSMSDPYFERTVIYLCAHSAEGAMGLVVNKLRDDISFPDILEQIGLEDCGPRDQIRVHYGGPVETTRGFVLHSTDFMLPGTVVLCRHVALTATVDVLEAIAEGKGPEKCLLALGYAGWGPGQLEAEIQRNGWLHVEPDPRLLFEDDDEEKWRRAVGKLGVDPSLLSGEAGHA